jgi:glucose/arabinose dehydrogenase
MRIYTQVPDKSGSLDVIQRGLLLTFEQNPKSEALLMIRHVSILLVVGSIVCQTSLGQTYPAGFSGTNLATSLLNPTAFCIAPDGTAYVCLQDGTMRVWKQGPGLLPDEFFLNNPLTVDSDGERGLLGVAVDPDFVNNRFVYVYYTASTPATHNRISRFTANAAGELAIAGSETILLDLNDLSATNHNGGAIHFGPDGKLYAAVGENAVPSNAQSTSNLLGKILRINTTPGSVIPTDNPASFPGISGTPAGNNRAIWAVGLRNPFTFAFHPVTGRMFINDVGNSAWEEINDGIAGRNYGWPDTEGDFDPVVFPDFTRPFYTYPRTGGPVTGQAIAGGSFYVPPISPYPPDYYGDYIFGDFVFGWIKRIDVNTSGVTSFVDSASGVVDMHIEAQGRLVYVARGLSALVRVNYAPLFAPSVTMQPINQAVCVGDLVKVSVSVAANPAPSFAWRRNGAPLSNGGGISGANTPTLVITGAQPVSAGTHDCFIQNSQGSATSNVAVLNVGVPNSAYDGRQLQPFIDAVRDSSTTAPEICGYDFSGNDIVDFADIGPMVNALLAL